MTVEELKGFAGGLGVTANITQITEENAQKINKSILLCLCFIFSTPVWVI